jgi:N4-gp56 family major capsid protein
MPGDVITLQRYVDMAKKTGTLTEDADVTAPALATPTQTQIQLQEFGNAAIVTRKLQLTSLADVDPDIATLIARNMADSIDEVVMQKLITGANVIRVGNGASPAGVGVTNTITADQIRKGVAKMRTNNVSGKKGSLYWCGIHPEVSHDLRAATGAGSWRLPHEYNANQNIWAGEIGQFEGAYFVESPRLYNAVDGADGTPFTAVNSVTVTATGSSAAFTITASLSLSTVAKVGDKVSGTGIATGAKITAISASGLVLTLSLANTGAVSGTLQVTPVAKVYRTILAGKQALAEAVAEEPHTVIGPVTDTLKRFRPIGWYGVLGFGIYREQSLFRIESSSTIQI